MRPHGRIRTTGQRALSNCRLLAMHYDMRPDRVGWTLFDVTTGRPVVWDDVPLTGVDLDAAHELLVLLHRYAARGPEKRVVPASLTEGSDSVLIDAPDPPVRPSHVQTRLGIPQDRALTGRGR